MPPQNKGDEKFQDFGVGEEGGGPTPEARALPWAGPARGTATAEGSPASMVRPTICCMLPAEGITADSAAPALVPTLSLCLQHISVFGWQQFWLVVD